ncbi:7671_t:CDS:2 [Ambispora leptoticha]|uniref:7671_t:CDS:1 n=1 Tax=Ambispora leptoticha TaxID=144679 RepID=A0A9N9AFQ6_9GLOM|nr:7671_t:CDS:2 [Ambispora leptoticha]
MVNNSIKQCILAVGKTGNGKSFTGTILGAQTRVGSTSNSETNQVSIHPCGNDRFYIDTPGFDDSDENVDDANTARAVLKSMADQQIHKLNTILWFVTPDLRATQSYKRQARFIESLAQYHDGNVWDNTIIVTKGLETGTGAREAALETAKKFYKLKHGEEVNYDIDLLENTKTFQIYLFENLDERNVYRKQNFDSGTLNEYGIYKKSEPERIRAAYETLMAGHEKHPVKLLFIEAECLNCPEKSDPRLASSNCHGQLTSIHGAEHKKIHTGQRIKRHTRRKICKHPGPLISYHPGNWYRSHTDSSFTHPGQIIGGTPYTEFHHYLIFVLGTETKYTPKTYSCCGGDPGSDGCSYACCGSKSTAGCKEAYTCCGSLDKCKQKYSCCGSENAKGCVNNWECCGEESDDGCLHEYTCCKASQQCEKRECCSIVSGENGKGCHPVFKCCGGELYSTGCQSVCQVCREDIFSTPGCGAKTKHDYGPNVPQPYGWHL